MNRYPHGTINKTISTIPIVVYLRLLRALRHPPNLPQTMLLAAAGKCIKLELQTIIRRCFHNHGEGTYQGLVESAY